MVDTTLGRYRILGKLGEGGMAEVHMAEDSLLHRCVAVKTLRSSGLRNPDMVQRFQQEATTVSRLGHANIVQVFDLGARADGDYLVMEFLDRGSVSRILAGIGGHLDPVCAVCVAVQAAEGLAAAHEAGVVHRDVKPDNLLVSRQGVVNLSRLELANASRALLRNNWALSSYCCFNPPKASFLESQAVASQRPWNFRGDSQWISWALSKCVSLRSSHSTFEEKVRILSF